MTGHIEWRCFHCGEVFTDQDEAGVHFGSDEADTCACILPQDQPLIQYIREQEKELREHRREDTASYREFYSLGSDHAQALRREEEKGYARGLADGRKETANGER